MASNPSIGSSYLLATTALQPLFGRIYIYFNIKHVYIFALVIFQLGSIICATAQNSIMLIIGRAVAGAGASGLFSGAMTIVGFATPLNKRPICMASISCMYGIASLVAPVLGGVFTDKVTWRWCFWVSFYYNSRGILLTNLTGQPALWCYRFSNCVLLLQAS